MNLLRLANKNRLGKWWVLIFFVLLLPHPTHAQGNPDPPPHTNAHVIAQRSAVLRAGPGVSFKQVAVLPRGTYLQLIGRNAARETPVPWYQAILDDGRTGWVLSSQVQLFEDAVDLPVVSSAKTAPAKISDSGNLTGVNVAALKAVFQRGQKMGRRARVFSKIDIAGELVKQI